MGTGVGTLEAGAVADIAVFDPDMAWRLTPETIASRGLNTPFMGWELRGRVCHTIHEGRVVFSRLGWETE